MEKELLEVYNAAQKAADAAETDGGAADVDRCVQALMRLREMPVTVRALVDTQVGKKLRSNLTKHPQKKIHAAASDLCDLWKKKVIEETAKNNKSIDSIKKSVRPDQVEIKNVDKIQKNGAMEINKVSRLETVRVENRVSGEKLKVGKVPSVETLKVETNGQGKEDKRALTPTKPSIVKCNDATREKTQELFIEALSKVSGEVSEDIKGEVEACDPVRIAISLESIMFEKLGRSNGVNKVKYRSILFNLKDQKNPDLRRRVLLGQIKPENVINLTAEEMASDERKRQNSQIKEKALFECERGQAPKATTDQFKCGRCGQRKCTYYQMQTRSADEPMTTYVTCVNCNNHWKFC